MTSNRTRCALFLCVITGFLLFICNQLQKYYIHKRALQQQVCPLHMQLPIARESEYDSSHSYLKSLPVEIVPDLLNPGNFLKPNMTPVALETAFNRWIKQIQIGCSDRRRLGHKGDGGWDVCFDPPFQMIPNNCLVYSFGRKYIRLNSRIARDWSFDDDISKNYRCMVHSFDPSIGKSDHNRSDKITFHDLGLTGWMKGPGNLILSKSVNHPEWKWNTLHEIRRNLRHQNIIIDYLKIDIETSEFAALPAIFQDGDLWTVKQIGFEIHTKNYRSPKRFDWIYRQLLQLELLGFRRFHYHENDTSKIKRNLTGKMIIITHEIYYLNANFFKSTQ